MNSLVIKNLRLDIGGDHREVSADVDGERVFFRAPLDYIISARPEPFIGIALPEAMLRKADIRVESSTPLSAKVSGVLPELQSVFACWNSDLRPVKVCASVAPCTEEFDPVASFYSGGVDGSHTLARNLRDITHLIMLSGFELASDSSESWRLAVEKTSVFARAIGKRLVPVETNAKQWSDKRRIHWSLAQGFTLASMAPLLCAHRLYIAASHTYRELFPWGSHPLTDPMWSTESTTVIHDGAASRRGEKMKELSKHPQILDNLKVCWHSIHDNCGKCPKCIRTMMALHLLGVSTKALPGFKYSSKAMKTFQVRAESGASFVEDAMILAQESGSRRIYRALRRYYRQYQLRQLSKTIDRYMLSGALRRAYRSFAKSRHKPWRVEVIGAEDWDV